MVNYSSMRTCCDNLQRPNIEALQRASRVLRLRGRVVQTQECLHKWMNKRAYSWTLDSNGSRCMQSVDLTSCTPVKILANHRIVIRLITCGLKSVQYSTAFYSHDRNTISDLCNKVSTGSMQSPGTHHSQSEFTKDIYGYQLFIGMPAHP